MKKSIWLAAGVAGMLLGNPATEAKGAVSVLINARDGHSFVLESRPSFIMLPEKGFSVAVGSPYDIVFYDNRYYLNQNGSWYRSSNYRGPWTFIKTKHLPSRIRRHRLDEIRSFRDTEYRRHDQRNNQGRPLVLRNTLIERTHRNSVPWKNEPFWLISPPGRQEKQLSITFACDETTARASGTLEGNKE